MNDSHNPQSRTPEQFGGEDGWRLLTVEEAAVLTDRHSAKTVLGRHLLTLLAPQFWSQSACRWVACDIAAKNPTLSEVLTYRTQSPHLPPTIPVPCPMPGELEAAAGDFIESHNFLAAFHHEIMIEKGFWKSRNMIVEACKAYELEYDCGNLSAAAIAAVDCQALALVTTEVSEMVEGIRHGNGPDDKIPEFSAAEAEAADVYLRLMDLAHGRGWRIAEAVIAKIAMNKTREKMHGGKRF